jgi:hypothetical protein
MEFYIYRADVYCEPCGDQLVEKLPKPENPLDERTYDSDDYPKGPYSWDLAGPADTPQHCAECGVFLENPLTEEGYKYLAEVTAYSGVVDVSVLRTWENFYGRS